MAPLYRPWHHLPMRHEFTLDHLARVIAGQGFADDENGMPVRLVARAEPLGPQDAAPALDSFGARQNLRIDGNRSLRGHVGIVGDVTALPNPGLFSAGATIDVRGAGRFVRGADPINPSGRWHPISPST